MNANTPHHIILIGMPGAGKSTSGVILAKVLNYDFIDSDLVIQRREGRRLNQIIAEEGINGFLKIENRINRQIEPCHPSVIATGGSVVYGKEAMAHFRSIGTVVYLRLGYDLLKRRLGNLDARGVVHRPNQSLKGLYRERSALYERYAHITVELDNRTIEQTVDDIAAAISSHNPDHDLE